MKTDNPELECPLLRRKTITVEFWFYGIPLLKEFRNLNPVKLKSSVKLHRNFVVRNYDWHSTLKLFMNFQEWKSLF